MTKRHARLSAAVAVAVILGGIAVFNRQLGEGVTPLMKAAHSGDTAALATLVKETANIDETSRYGWTALMFAAWRGHSDAVDILLEAGADPNVISVSIPSSFETVMGHPPTTALREAIRGNHIGIANTLLDRRATVDPVAFALAGQVGDIPLLKRFLELGMDVNRSSGNVFHASALCAAASAGKLDVVKWLISKGADPNLIAVSHTALGEAVEADEVEIVRYLVEKGADPNLIYGITAKAALFTAATKHTNRRNYSANLEIIRILLANGADRSHRAFNGQHTALDFVRIQKKNALKYISETRGANIGKQLEASLKHEDAIIDLLEK